MNQQQLFKVRDLRKKDQFKIDDKYLNGYARILGIACTAVYNSLSRHAEFHTQEAFPSEQLIADEHGITARTVRTAIKKLKETNIIQIEKKRTSGGKWLNNTYYLVDKSEWKQPEEIKDLWLTRGKKRHEPEEIGSISTRGSQRPIKDTHTIKDTNNKDTHIATMVAEYNFENKLNELLKDKRQDLHIIGLYWQYKGFSFQNSAQWQAALKRELRPAKNLVGYSDDEIIGIMDWLIDNVDFKWSLETCHKYINEDLSIIKNNKKYGITKN